MLYTLAWVIDRQIPLAQGSERRAELAREEFWLLPRREVAALVHRMEVDQVAIGALGPMLPGA